MKILNLGAGNDVKKGAVNHDISKHRPEIDIVYDLNQVPWCFHDAAYDQVYALSVFEHLTITLIQALDECHRILKPNGKLFLKFPLYTSPTIHDDPTHIWHWSDKVLDYVDPETEYGRQYAFYTRHKWLIVSKENHKDLSCHAQLMKR